VNEYDPQAIEQKWQKVWAEQKAFHADVDASRPKFYMLEMLPYPSGTLHMGHMRNYTIGDAVARYKWMRGYNVIHPIGWDAFGLPAENAAMERNVHPREWTLGNVAEFTRVCNRFGFSYDWRREISTCEPEYYRWNQWFFLRMLERGLAYRKKSRVNWCPKCQTVLANEQVVEGCCWRHQDTPVEAREIEQWFLRITAYADQLLDDMKEIEAGWPERVLTMQRNWIGKSRGARIRFALDGADGQGIEIFTTRIDTIYGATAVILAFEHPLIQQLIADNPKRAQMEASLARMRQMSVKMEDLATAEKEGFFTGHYAVNPFNGEKLPIWVANFVLMEYGTGAVMAVPAHDERDFEFCRKYDLPVRVVVQPLEGEPLSAETMGEAFEEHEQGTVVNSGPYSGLSPQEAISRMTADAEAKGFGRGETTYRLKDWGISRQRYWGTPIPVVYCQACGMLPVPDGQLPVVLPANVAITGKGQSPLAGVPEFVNTKCPKCGGAARRETDTMDTFVDSSWYFFRYADPKNHKAPFDKEIIRYWLPVDQYVGGIVHAILHLMYTRFFCKVMRDLGLVKFNEPVTRLFCQGTVLKGGVAMSKSRGNVVGAVEMAEKYGCDTARVYSLFTAPPEKDMEWDEQGIEGASRFLHKVFRLVMRWAEVLRGVPAETVRFADSGGVHRTPETGAEVSVKEKALLRKAHQTLRRITQDFDQRWHFNTSVAALMELVNEIQAAEPFTLRPAAEGLDAPREGPVTPGGQKEILTLLVQMLGPFAPHLAEELWQALGYGTSLVRAPWPEYSAGLAQEEQFEVVVQVNGKLRSRLVVDDGLSEEELVKRALGDERVAAHLSGKRVVKKIVVPNKLVNIVVA
jgi:leucyl-tRNA synthetase